MKKEWGEAWGRGLPGEQTFPMAVLSTVGTAIPLGVARHKGPKTGKEGLLPQDVTTVFNMDIFLNSDVWELGDRKDVCEIPSSYCEQQDK